MRVQEHKIKIRAATRIVPQLEPHTGIGPLNFAQSLRRSAKGCHLLHLLAGTSLRGTGIDSAEGFAACAALQGSVLKIGTWRRKRRHAMLDCTLLRNMKAHARHERKKASLSICYFRSPDNGCFPNLPTFVVGQGRTTCEKGMLAVWTISTAYGQFQVDF